MVLWIFLACKPDPQPPTCTDDFEYACFRGIFRTLIGSSVEGVEVCAPEVDGIDCVTTDQDGAWKIPGLPKDSNVFLTASHPDYAPSLFPQHTSMDWYDWYKVAIPTSVMDSNANRLDIEIDENKGQFLFLTWKGLNIDGVDTDNVPEVTLSQNQSFPYLFYGNAIGVADPDQESTTNSGSGGILNLDPGETSLQLNSPNGSCTQEHMFHYQQVDDNIPIPIRAGFTTAIDVICPTD